MELNVRHLPNGLYVRSILRTGKVIEKNTHKCEKFGGTTLFSRTVFIGELPDL